jgi:hypothetical protein
MAKPLTPPSLLVFGNNNGPYKMERKLSKLQSTVGREASFGSGEEEVARILKHKTNYYLVLKGTTPTRRPC